MSTLTTELAAKSVQLMKELLPQAVAIAYLLNPTNPTAAAVGAEALAAATALAIDLHVVNASKEPDLDPAFAELAQRRASGVIAGEPFLDSQREKLVALSARHRLPAIYTFREYVLAGGLMSYGTSITESYRQAAIYVGRILKGESASDLPVQRPTKFELVINLKTAKALGLEIPPTLLARADEVIE
jgi:putative tryptophan/tyrosine transport system substrate-binding protein